MHWARFDAHGVPKHETPEMHLILADQLESELLFRGKIVLGHSVEDKFRSLLQCPRESFG